MCPVYTYKYWWANTDNCLSEFVCLCSGISSVGLLQKFVHRAKLKIYFWKLLYLYKLSRFVAFSPFCKQRTSIQNPFFFSPLPMLLFSTINSCCSAFLFSFCVSVLKIQFHYSPQKFTKEAFSSESDSQPVPVGYPLIGWSCTLCYRGFTGHIKPPPPAYLLKLVIKSALKASLSFDLAATKTTCKYSHMEA